MAGYLGNQIILGGLNYTDVVTKYPELKGAIDTHLTTKGYTNLIV